MVVELNQATANGTDRKRAVFTYILVYMYEHNLRQWMRQTDRIREFDSVDWNSSVQYDTTVIKKIMLTELFSSGR